jgi:tRNA threonylcarbamoyladenosine biosynthesis protein TsaB
MRILGIDSSADTVAVSLLEDKVLKASFCGNMKKTHSNTLLPTIEYLLSYAGLKPDDIDLYCVAVGPGSFTGIRIGVATVKGLSFANNCRVCAVSTLEAMAYSFADREGEYVCPVLNARRGDVYNALFKITNGIPVRITDDDSFHASTLEKILKPYENVLFCGDGVQVIGKIFTERKVNAQNELLTYPTGVGVALAGLAAYERGEYTTGTELAPVYLKPSQAERERIEKLNDKK